MLSWTLLVHNITYFPHTASVEIAKPGFEIQSIKWKFIHGQELTLTSCAVLEKYSTWYCVICSLILVFENFVLCLTDLLLLLFFGAPWNYQYTASWITWVVVSSEDSMEHVLLDVFQIPWSVCYWISKIPLVTAKYRLWIKVMGNLLWWENDIYFCVCMPNFSQHRTYSCYQSVNAWSSRFSGRGITESTTKTIGHIMRSKLLDF
jgi:hypothetical protein